MTETKRKTIAGKWGYADAHEAFYSGAYDTAEEAAEAGALEEGQAVTVGQYREPGCLEYVDAESVLDGITCQDDYCGEWAEGAFDCTKEQEQELTALLQNALREWLDKHDLWPTFGIVEATKKVTVGNSH